MESQNKTASSIWGGRFTQSIDAQFSTFNASIYVDKTLYREDIACSIAHARMLAKQNILSTQELKDIEQGLRQILHEIHQEKLAFRTDLEDVHMHIEHRLTALIGEAGKKLHTARSRNDQVATDTRLWLRNAIDSLQGDIICLGRCLLNLAKREVETIMPGFTHLQIAQPIVFGHHLLAWFGMLRRDYERLVDCRKRVNCLPLGSAALAGTTWPIDREYVAQLLGFDEVIANSLDGVSDRDFIIEFCTVAAQSMVHFSRWCEECIVWSSQLVGFIELPDSLCTGSSIMPQKKNPDLAELIRGKSARVCSDAFGLCMLMKAQTLAYNKDNQEDKAPLFATVDTWRNCVQLLTAMFDSLQTRADVMRQAFHRSYANATELADYLVSLGIPFRDAHEQTGKLVHYAIAQQCNIEDLPLTAIQRFAPKAREEVYFWLDVDNAVARRTSTGGTAPTEVKKQIAVQEQWLDNLSIVQATELVSDICL